MPIHREDRDQVVVLTIERREALNAFNTEQLRALIARIQEVEDDANVRAVVLTGDGSRAFAAGADIKEMESKDSRQAYEFARLGHEIGRRIENAPQPWIAAVNGYAFGGGCELALACDLRLASENAVFAQPEVGLGIPPGWGGTQRLPRIVGPGFAAEMIYTGRWVKAEEALRVGLVNAVYHQDELLSKAVEMAESIAKNAPLAVRASKELIRISAAVPGDVGLEHEAQKFALLFGSQDQREGMNAFGEKRTPEFTGQ